MKKKGFTLIELLAVIVILAIITLIATPIIMRVIENSKKSTVQRSAENYIKELETVIVAERLNGNIIEDGLYTLDSNGDVCLDSECTNKLVVTMTGSRPSSGRVQIENEKATAYTITIGEYENTYGIFTILPFQYQKVEYLRSTGTQYIDTGISGGKNPEFNIKFSLTDVNYGWHKIFGMVEGDDASGIKLRTNNNKFYCWIYKKYISEYQGSIELNTLYNFDLININGTYNFNVNNTLIGSYTEAHNWGNNITVFGSPSKQAGENGYSYMLLYGLVMKTDGILVRDFIPCYSTTTVTDVNGNECEAGTIGLYDLVEGKFYTNSGSGEFLKGNDI